jgi:fucose permease
MFLVGMEMAETGAALERMTAAFDLTPSQQGLLVSLRFVGGLVVGLLLWAGHAHVRFKEALGAALILVVVSGPFLLLHSYEAAVTIAILRGLSMGVVIPLSGMFAAAQRRWKPGQVAATVNATLSAGMVLLSLFATVLAATMEVSWEAYWVPASALGAVLLLMLPFVVFPRSGAGAGAGDGPIAGTTWTYAAAGLLLVGSEGVLLGLMPAQTVLASGTGAGGELLALYLMGGVLVGRTAGTWLFNRFAPVRVLTGSIVVLAAAAIGWTVFPSVAPAMLFVHGCATANLFPGIISHISHERPESAGATIASIGWTGGLGGTVVPSLAGAALGVGFPVRLLTVFVIIPSLGAYLLARTVGSSRAGAVDA